MEKFIPYEKQSKKAKKALNAARRGSWGAVNPITRKPENSKAYDRARTKNRKIDFPDSSSLLFM